MQFMRFGIATFAFYPVTWLAMLLGGWGLALAPLVIFSTHLILDNAFRPDHDSYRRMQPWLSDAYLYLHIPCGALTYILLMWQAAPDDMLGVGVQLSALLGHWVLVSHHAYTFGQLIACAAISGLMMSTNTIVAHELVHRRSNPWALTIGRILLGLNGDAQFAISHVYGHHMQVATPKDPATARRGESVYRFALRSTVGQYREAAALERQRLVRLGKTFWNWQNHFLQSIVMTAFFVVISFLLAGTTGLFAWLVSALVTKFLLEVVNYIQHYGLVRVAGERVEPRHSWDCDSKGATWVFYGLSRHSNHHNKPALIYTELMPIDAATGSPRLDVGYIACMFMATMPPVWHRWATPRLLEWDKRLASTEERRLANLANRQSRCSPLVAASTTTLYTDLQ